MTGRFLRCVRRWARGRPFLLVFSAALFISIGPSRLLAQAEKLAGRFPPATEAALRAILDSASAHQVAVAPLTQRALEGASRGIEPERIVSVVHGLYTRLLIARRSLGESASEAELMAAASALYMGVSPDILERIHRTTREGKSALRLVVLTDMMDRGVPRDTATSIILSLSDADVPDESLQLLRQSMLLDIKSGVAPALAARTRARGVLAEHEREKRVPTSPPRRP